MCLKSFNGSTICRFGFYLNKYRSCGILVFPYVLIEYLSRVLLFLGRYGFPNSLESVVGILEVCGLCIGCRAHLWDGAVRLCTRLHTMAWWVRGLLWEMHTRPHTMVWWCAASYPGCTLGHWRKCKIFLSPFWEFFSWCFLSHPPFLSSSHPLLFFGD